MTRVADKEPVTDTHPVWVWGVPLAPYTMEQALDAVDQAIMARRPTYFITANLYYAMLTHQHPDMDPINRGAAFILADGMPLVWASRWRGRKLPERVAGSDMIYRIAERSARLGHRLYFMGGAPGVGDEAAEKLRARYPGVQIVGIESPNIGAMSEAEAEALRQRIQTARPDVLFVALGQPKGERWIAQNLQALGVPVSVQVGATLDFVAGRVKRAPRWMQKTGVEWVYRMLQEPRRLGPRYFWSALFLSRMLGRDLLGAAKRERHLSAAGAVQPAARSGASIGQGGP
jgi:N-acetylglucosaminyldiphosphoundecaprenol N-acetyl-beta-D-mannosaminyltransferase